MDYRKPKTGARKYKKYRNSLKRDKIACIFCEFDEKNEEIIELGKFFIIAKNKFPYNIWDGFEVSEHFLIIPKKHTETISDFSKEEMLEFSKLIAKYEKNGYSIYSRSPQNLRKTIPHEHTHLIKLNYKRPVKFLVNIKAKFLWFK